MSKNTLLSGYKEGVITITKENEHLHPKEAVEALRFFEKELAKGRIFAPKKYYASQKSMLITDTVELFKSSPDLPLKQVLFKIMEPLPDFLPAENLVAVTKIITSTWEELRKKVAA